MASKVNMTIPFDDLDRLDFAWDCGAAKSFPLPESGGAASDKLADLAAYFEFLEDVAPANEIPENSCKRCDEVFRL